MKAIELSDPSLTEGCLLLLMRSSIHAHTAVSSRKPIVPHLPITRRFNMAYLCYNISMRPPSPKGRFPD